MDRDPYRGADGRRLTPPQAVLQGLSKILEQLESMTPEERAELIRRRESSPDLDTDD